MMLLPGLSAGTRYKVDTNLVPRVLSYPTLGTRLSRHGGIEVPQWVFRDPCGFVVLRYVILKFLRVNLFL